MGLARLEIRNLSITSGDRLVVNNLSVSATDQPVYLVGDSSGAEALSATLGRRATDHIHVTTGVITVGDIDHRIRAPLTLIEEPSTSPSGTVRSAFLARLAPDDVLDVFRHDDAHARRGAAGTHIDEVLAEVGLRGLEHEQRLDEISNPETRCRLSLAFALASGPPGLLIRWDTWPASTRHFLEGMAPTLAQRRPVLFLGGEQPPETGQWAAMSTPGPKTATAPEHFTWVLHGELGGMARPGRGARVDREVAFFSAGAIDVLVGLEEDPHDAVPLRAGLHYVHFPIPDMAAPKLADALQLLRRLRGLRTAFHCHEGIGRTGTLLALELVLRGYRANEALDLLRLIKPHFVQSEVQLALVGEAERAWRDGRHA